MTFYVLLYDIYCITVPSSWVNLKRYTVQMPKNTKQLTQMSIKQSSPDNDWEEREFRKNFGLYKTYESARSVEKAVGEMSVSDDNIILPTVDNSQKKRLIKKRKFYGCTSNDEDERISNKRITMPSNYIPQIESQVSNLASPSASNSIVNPKPGLLFIYVQHTTNTKFFYIINYYFYSKQFQSVEHADFK
ncbi:uncharacterized protein [Linepithema humile]|uniref:uncharacterized protein n=1 Tax=Linepithema humile TaxID=83485 RepID=UPI00351DEC07